MSLAGLQQLNIELTSRCSKRTKCSFCGHQDGKGKPKLKFGDISMDLLRAIRRDLPPPTIVSFHRDGDPLDYPELRDALLLFLEFPTSIVTHGERLAERADEIIDRATTVTVSVVPNDPDREIQIASVRAFLDRKRDLLPRVQLKFVGNIERPEEYEALGVPITGRRLHSKKGNWNYERQDPAVPEIGVCLDFLSRPTVDWQGRVFVCNRLDPEDAGLIGDLNEQSLEDIWNGPRRRAMLEHHLAGRRDLANPLCASCKYYGIPAA